jgi:hypothetical protein
MAREHVWGEVSRWPSLRFANAFPVSFCEELDTDPVFNNKTALSVLVRNYRFELRDGADTRFEMGRMILQRLKVVGEEGCCVPLRIRRVEKRGLVDIFTFRYLPVIVINFRALG